MSLLHLSRLVPRGTTGLLVRALGVAVAVGGAAGCDGHDDGGRIQIRARDCVVCHEPEYEATRNPPHPGLFPRECVQCHGTDAWSPAVLVEHPWWPIENRHAELLCTDCHTVGFTAEETPDECVGCHLDDYESRPFPGHDAFPTNCLDCHTTAGWTPAVGGHPEAAFPIERGDHRGIDCNDCHDASLGPYTDGLNADCVGCHTGEHDRSRMDDKHDDVRGYPGDDRLPSFCLDCHPAGREADD